MGIFRKARSRSQSTGSVTPRPLVQDTDRDTFVLPRNDHIYVTQTKDGKPALGRKKPARLLQDFGFDILGQSLGVPSRRDYENQARPLSALSQSSGLVTAPGTPRLSREARFSNEKRQMYAYEDTESPVVRRRTSSMRSSSTPAPIGITRCPRRDASKSQQHIAHKRIPSFQSPRMFNQPHIPPPPPPPPNIVGWHNSPATNIGMGPIPISYYSPAYYPGYQPSYTYNNTAMPQGAQIWGNPQCYAGAQHPNLPGIVLPQNSPQTPAMPILPNHRQFSQSQPAQFPYTQAIPATHLANMPPPPPRPQQSWAPAHNIATNQRETSQQNKTQLGGARTIVNQADQTGKSSKSAELMPEKSPSVGDVKRTLSRRIRHVHVCGGCGKKRSTRYQKAHPLRRGEIPALNYCYDCLKDAADTDDGASDGDNAETTKAWPTDESRAPTGGKYPNERSRRDHRWVKKSNRIRSLPKPFSCKADLNPPPLPPRSISSAEVSSSRASSPGPDLDAIDSIYTPVVSPDHHSYESPDNGITQDETEPPARSPQQYTKADSSNSKHNSPLVPREAMPGTATDKGKTEVRNKNKPTLAQLRTRIPRPMRQSVRVDRDPSLLRNARDPARVLDRQRVSSHLETRGAEAEVPMPQPAAIRRTSKHMIPEGARGPAKQTHTQEAIKGAEKNPIPSSKLANAPDVPNDVRGRKIRASTKDSLKKPVAVASETTPKGGVYEPTDYADNGLSSAEPQAFSEINTEPTSAHRRVSGSENSARRPPSSDLPRTADEFDAVFDWYEPLTPKDAPYANTSYSPRVASDSWSEFQTDMEREAEEMAEQDLAFAGKLFDSLSDSLGGSATSAFPLSSYVTTSNMSIVSYYSDSDSECSDSEIAVANNKEARIQKTAKTIEAKKPARQIEFSSEKERQQRSATSKTSTSLTVAYPERFGNRIAKLPDCQKNNKYNKNGGEHDDDSENDYFLSPIGSSLIGHTGHSADDLLRDTSTRGGLAALRNRHGLRRTKWLSSA